VTLYTRNDARVADTCYSLPQAEAVVVGDLSSIAEMRRVAEQVNALGRYDAVIHNAGVGFREPHRIETVDGLSHIFAINVVAPYLLTALVTPPDRLIYLSSGMHMGGAARLDDPQWTTRRWNGAQAYATSKLLDVVLAFAVARRWPNGTVECS
jgi:NAD(P)-dependent dehydrogenase (short-subunit alcohol dehydrogenase family)